VTRRDQRIGLLALRLLEVFPEWRLYSIDRVATRIVEIEERAALLRPQP
jgi:hypothetical protein